MKADVFAVLDMCAEMYMEPFFSTNVDTAIRSFKMGCEDPGGGFHNHPEDFALYHVGEWDAKQGKMTAMEPHKIANATSFVARETTALLTDSEVADLYEDKPIKREA